MAILQVLYFIPELRAALLAVRPDPDEEFSLLDETTLLFRMLLAGGPAACQATNLLRALRQNRGAAALGLLETHSQRSGENTDIEVSSICCLADDLLLRASFPHFSIFC